MNNLYDYEIKAENGQIRTFKSQPNKLSKEFNLSQLKTLFITAKITGRIYNQNNKNEVYIFVNGQEKRTLYLGNIKEQANQLQSTIKKALELSQNINLNIKAVKSLNDLEQIYKELRNQSQLFLSDLNEFINAKKELDIKPIYNFDKKGR